MHNHSMLGGTFDHFHKGHESFIKSAITNSKKLTIGITSDEMLGEKANQDAIEPYSRREQSVKGFLLKNNYEGKTEVLKINDIYGPSIRDNSLDAIYVISDTHAGAVKVNAKRESLGLKKLEIVKVPTLDMNDSKRISSTEIRLGSIDRNGIKYSDLFPTNETLHLPNNLRDKLKAPFGEVIKSLNIKNLDDKFIIAVGDIVVSNLFRKGVSPNISIFDKVSNREKIADLGILDLLPRDVIKLKNIPGAINCSSAVEISNLIQKSVSSKKAYAIEIIGEEDLLALPAMLFAPLDALVIYGLKSEGAVIVTITEDLKKEVTDIISEWKI